MIIEITPEERKELESICLYVQSSTKEAQKLGIALLKKYDKFRNTVFCYDYLGLTSTYELRYIKRTVDNIFDNSYTSHVHFFSFNNIFANIADVNLQIVAFYIKAILDGNDSFYIG